MIEPSPDTTLSVLLARVKDELDAMTAVVGDMQAGLSPFLSGMLPADAATTYQHAQNIDLLWQTLDSLSHVLQRAALDERSDRVIDIETFVGTLPLAALASRLRGHAPVVAAGGEPDFF